MKNPFPLLVLGMISAFSLPFASATPPATNPSPRIRSIGTDGSNVIVTVDVPAHLVRVVLETTSDLGAGPWQPLASQWLRGEARDVQFAIPAAEPLEFLRVRTDDSGFLPLPLLYYQGPTDFPPRWMSDPPPASFPVALQQNFGSGAIVAHDAQALGRNPGSDLRTLANRTALESDLWRVDGRTVYYFNANQGLQVIDLTDVDVPVLRGTLRLPGTGDQLYVLPGIPVGSERALALLSHGGDQCLDVNSGATSVQIVFIRRGTPHAGPKLAVPGQLKDSRLVGDVLYLVTEAWNSLPPGLATGTGFGLWRRETRITTIHLLRPNAPVVGAPIVLPGMVDAVHATDQRLYVALTGLETSEQNRPAAPWLAPGAHGIKVFNLNAASGVLREAGFVPTAGRVLDKFKMYERGEVLDVVSLEANGSQSTLETWSLARPRRPRRLARLPIVAGESLFATRFDGARLYVVTFRQIDPLLIIDLSDPEHPQIRGELAVPGWSTYLHPMGDRLVAMGLEGTHPTLSLFDVTQASAPRLIQKILLLDPWGFSEANETEKAFTVLADQGLVLVPVSGARGTNRLQGTQLVDFDRSGLTLRGLIEHRSGALRGAAIDSSLISLSTSDLLTVDASDRDRPVVRGRVALQQVVDRVWAIGAHMLQLERGESTGATNSELRVSTQAAPRTALTRVAIPGPAVMGESLRAGRLYLVQGTSQSIVRAPGTTVLFTNRARLKLSVFDTTQLPVLPSLAETEFAPPDYFGGTLTALWPNEETLVWRSSGPINTVIPFALQGFGNARTAITDANPNPIAIVAEAAVISPPIQLIGPWFPWWSERPTRLFAIALGASTPRFVSDLVLPANNQARYGASFAANGLVFAGRTVTADQPILVSTNGQPAQISPPILRHHEVIAVDYRIVTQPSVRAAVRVPGSLAGIARQGALWFALGPHATDTNDSATRLHALAYDGSVASLIDSLSQTNVTTASALIDESGGVLAGESGAVGRSPHLVRWELDAGARFRRRTEISLDQPAVALAQFEDLLAVVTTTQIELRDALEGRRYRRLHRSALDCNLGVNLGIADGSQASGLWLPRGVLGLDRVPVPARPAQRRH